MNGGDAEQIHEASLSLLEDPGVRIEHDDVLDLVLRAGAKRGRGPSTAQIPRKMVAQYLDLCPCTVDLADRRGERITLSARGPTVFWSCPGLYLHRNSGHRPFTSSDMADMARLLEQLDNVHAIFGLSLDDVQPEARDVVGLNVIARNSSKHIRVLCFTPEGSDALVQMKEVVGGHPWFSVGFTAHGPLRWTKLALEIFKRTAGHGIPTSINGEPMAGVSGPVTLAGSAAVGNAEILAGIVINQLLEPGRPCIYNLGLAHTFDMRTAVAVTGGPENALFAKLAALMGRFYDIPSASWVSTEAMCPDSQAALEKMLGFHTHVESGVSCIWGVGQLESEMTISPAQAVIDNEMISYVRRYQRGVQVDEDSLALHVTRSVGIAGSFLEEMHTAENFRRELFMPSLLWRETRDRWNATGQKRLDQRAEEVADELISKDVGTGLADEQLEELDRLTSRFLREVAKG